MTDTHHDELGALDYASYLDLPALLSLPRPRTAIDDELLFIVMHQTFELWLVVVIDGLERSRAAMFCEDVHEARRQMRRVVAVERHLVAQFDLIETLPPAEFLRFRDSLGSASAIQSWQFCEVELLSGRGEGPPLDVFGPSERERLRRRASEPSVIDAFAELLDRRSCTSYKQLFHEEERWPGLVELADLLLDFDAALQLWRARHIQLVARRIGGRTGSAGHGIAFLRAAMERTLYPDLWAQRATVRG